VIPFTINEFPFWSFLFSDLHAHVIALPFSVLLLGMIASYLLARPSRSATGRGERLSFSDSGKNFIQRCLSPDHEERIARPLFYLLIAFVFGTIACINPWDMPFCALVLGAG